jgi:hypothetical protein
LNEAREVSAKQARLVIGIISLHNWNTGNVGQAGRQGA